MLESGSRVCDPNSARIRRMFSTGAMICALIVCMTWSKATMSAEFRCRSLLNPRSRARALARPCAERDARHEAKVKKQTHLLIRTNRLQISTKMQARRAAKQPTGSAELLDLSNKNGWAGERAVQHEAQLTRANNRSKRDERRSHHIWGLARRSRRGLKRARFAYFAPGRSRLASACKFLLISLAGAPAIAAPLAKPAAAGIADRCS